MSDEERQLVDYKLDQFGKTIGRLERAILGDGKAPGLVGRVVSLEEDRERQRWLVRTLVAAVILLGCKALWSAVAGS